MFLVHFMTFAESVIIDTVVEDTGAQDDGNSVFIQVPSSCLGRSISSP